MEYRRWNSEIKPVCMLYTTVFLLNCWYFYFVSLYYRGKLNTELYIWYN
jgi:hypothetical protein